MLGPHSLHQDGQDLLVPSQRLRWPDSTRSCNSAEEPRAPRTVRRQKLCSLARERALDELLSPIAGRRVRHISPPRWLARTILPWVSGMPRWQSNRVVELMVAIAAGVQAVPTGTVAQTLHREPRTIEAFLAELGPLTFAEAP